MKKKNEKVSWDELRLQLLKQEIELELIVDLGCATIFGIMGAALLFCIAHLVFGG